MLVLRGEVTTSAGVEELQTSFVSDFSCGKMLGMTGAQLLVGGGTMDG